MNHGSDIHLEHQGWIGKVINYAENTDKTKEQTSQELISESETGQLQGT